jgi:TATA-box binding protein (TBP) (component of TFIID and TFIIIB)
MSKIQYNNTVVKNVQINVIISNIVATFRLFKDKNIKIDPKKLANSINNSYYAKNKPNKLHVRQKNPNSTMVFMKNSNVTSIGTTTIEETKLTARRMVQKIRKIYPTCGVYNFKIVNVMSTCYLNFYINLVKLYECERDNYRMEYVQELDCGIVMYFTEPKVTFKIFSSGSCTFMTKDVNYVPDVTFMLYNIVLKYKIKK